MLGAELPGVTMAERRDRSVDVYMRDGVLRKGKPLGHADEKGRIREADTSLRKGVELGYVDERNKVRRRGGVLRRGDVVGRIRGNAAYVAEGLLGGGLKVGFIDDQGQAWQSDSAAFRGRVVGRVRGNDPETGLAYFLLKFAEIDDAVRVLEQKVQESEDRYAFLPRVRAMQRVLPEVDAIGDFDSLVRRLDALEEVCASDLGHHIEVNRAAIDEAVRSKPSPETILDSLRAEWGLSGLVPEQADALVGRVRGALGALSDVRDRVIRGEVQEEGGRRSQAHVSPSESRRPSYAPPADAAPLPSYERDDRSRRVEQLIDSAFGPVERLREEVDRIRRDPEYRAEELVDRVRSAMTTVLEAGERLVNDSGTVSRRRDERLPAPVLGTPANHRPSTPPPVPALPPPPLTANESTALVRFDDDPDSRTRAYVESLMATREAEQVFEILDLGIERLKEIETVRKDGVTRLRKAFDALRRPRR